MLHTLKTENGDGIVESEDGEIRRYRGDMPTGAAIIAAVAEIERLRFAAHVSDPEIERLRSVVARALARVADLEAELKEERALCIRRGDELNAVRQILGVAGVYGNPSPVVEAARAAVNRVTLAETELTSLIEAIAELARKAGA